MNSEARGLFETIVREIDGCVDEGKSRLITYWKQPTELALEQCILALWDDGFWVEHKKLGGKVYFNLEWN